MKEEFSLIPQQDGAETEQGDESGTGLDSLLRAIEGCRLMGEPELPKAIAKARNEMQAHKKWIFSREPILYLKIIIKGRDGVQTQGPVTLTRFSGKVDPRYADGIVEIIRLNEMGEHQNTLVRCSLKNLGPEGVLICEDYEQIGQSLITEIKPDSAGGFNLDVSVASHAFENGFHNDSPASNKDAARPAKKGRVRKDVAGGDGNRAPMFQTLTWTVSPSLVHYAASFVVACLMTLLVFESVLSYTPLRGYTSALRNNPTRQQKLGGATEHGLTQREAEARVVSVAAPVADDQSNEPEESPHAIQRGLLASVRITASNPWEKKRRERLATVDSIVIVIDPEARDKKMLQEMQSTFARVLAQRGFTVSKSRYEHKGSVLVTLNMESDGTAETKAVFVRMTDADGYLWDAKSGCPIVTSTQKHDALFMLSTYFADNLSVDIKTAKEQSVVTAPPPAPAENDAPKQIAMTY